MTRPALVDAQRADIRRQRVRQDGYAVLGVVVFGQRQIGRGLLHEQPVGEQAHITPVRNRQRQHPFAWRDPAPREIIHRFRRAHQDARQAVALHQLDHAIDS